MALFSRLIKSRLIAYIASDTALQKKRRKFEKKRRASGSAHVVEYFHQTDDPYSHLMLQVLPILKTKYNIEIRIHLVSSPPDWAAPEREKLIRHSIDDATLLAKRAKLSFQMATDLPAEAQTRMAENALSSLIEDNTFLEKALPISTALWANNESELNQEDKTSALTQAKLDQGNAQREALGHYLGATLYYAGEWYWGLDRLSFLEQRLSELGAGRDNNDDSLIYRQPEVPDSISVNSELSSVKPELHFFLSFRSPYTYIAMPRVRELAKAYGAELKLRFVLPMVMRGLPVPMTKKKYIFLDVAREARRLGIPYGRIVDPLGRPVERGYSLLPWAIECGRGAEYCWSFMQGVSANGWDADSDTGMKKIVEDAGLSWLDAKEHLGNDDWREEAEINQQELLGSGLWGVPSFRLNDVSVWGQDRLWVIEEELKRMQNQTN